MEEHNVDKSWGEIKIMSNSNWIDTLAPALNELAWTTRWDTTKKNTALQEIRKTDHSRYSAICKILKEDDIEMTDYVSLEYAYGLADDGPSPEDNAILSKLKTVVTDLLATLKPREERVLRKRFGIGLPTDYTLEEIGVEYSITKERVRQIEAKALRKLKHLSQAGSLIDFLDAA